MAFAGAEWIRCFCSVAFDIDKGQVLEECFPADAVRPPVGVSGAV